LLKHRIGVWDVYRQCRRQGALDAAIQSAAVNDFPRLREDAPQLQRVCFNGQTAGKFAGWFQKAGYQTLVLPSTSPAYTLAFDRKVGSGARRGWGKWLLVDRFAGPGPASGIEPAGQCPV
jgi:TDG/mug DNA glycosylase family protein